MVSTSASVAAELEAANRALDDGRKGDAERLLAAVLKRSHDCAEAHLLLGMLARERGDYEDARDSYTLAECFAGGWWPVHFQLGLLELDEGRPQGAIPPLSKALELGARDARVHNALGAAYTQTEQLEKAVEQYRAALELDPDLPEAHSNLGYILFRDLEDYDAGAEHIEKARKLAPQNVAVLCNWNMVLQHRGRLDEALALTDSLLARDANLAEARVTRALLLLMRGDFDTGWREYEQRKRLPRNRWPQQPPLPEWDGSSLSGRTIFVYSEQGIGDEIMFASCLPDLIAGAGRVIVECHPKLEPSFRRSFPEAVVIVKDTWQASDVFARFAPQVKVAAGTLPLYFRRRREQFPRHAGYLRADPARVEHWRAKLVALPGRLKVGISWRGGAPTTRRTTRSIPLELWGPLFEVPAVDFVSLQYSNSAEDIARARELYGVTIHHWAQAIEDYDETAALIASLDLVISVQTAVVHLAGALGQRVWALISAVPEWRYGAAGEDMPWYPNVRLIRQQTQGDWAPSLRRVADELRGCLTSDTPAAAAPASLADALRLLEEDRVAEAEAVARQVCSAEPHACEPRHVLGYILSRRGDLAGAVRALEEATRLDGATAELHYSLARAHFALGAFDNAAAAFRAALEIAPAWAPAWVSLADSHVALDQVDAAEDAYMRAIELAPGFAEAHYNFGNLLLRLGRPDDAVTSYQRALELKPEFRLAHTNLVYTLNFVDGLPAEQVFRAHVRWAKQHAEPFTRQAAPHIPRRARRPLRVGYVSPNFRRHAATYFFEPVLRHHGRDDFAIYCYADVRKPDVRTERLKQYECVWRDIATGSDEDVAALVRDDEIDILVDLTGHTENDRLLVFARKPAPIQITWNGYANTTGMTAMDYRITDAYCDPPGTTEHLHVERLVRMPEIYMPFEAPDDPVAPGEAPCVTRDHVTFGSFNALSKVNARMIGAWSQILIAIPSARLMMITVPEGRTRLRLQAAFAKHGIARERLEFRARLTERAFLEAHREIDIALDTYPFHGTTTTAHSLWMGVPVVTLAGAVHASRVGVSMLANVGLADLVASTEADYVARAVSLAADRFGLERLRSRLRIRMQAAPNMDGPRFTRALEAAYAKMWAEYSGDAQSSC